MKGSAHLLFFLAFTFRHLVRAKFRQEVGFLSELPFTELLVQRKVLEGRNSTEDIRTIASPSMAESPKKKISFKSLSKFPRGKTFHEEDYDDNKSHLNKKKHKIHDILNISLTALSYLAFGGYLLCMIANAMREKRRRIMMAFPSAGSTMSNQFAQVLQHYVTHRPVRPYIRFPTITVQQRGRKRRNSNGGRLKGTPLTNPFHFN